MYHMPQDGKTALNPLAVWQWGAGGDIIEKTAPQRRKNIW